jgi:hypothetical protein
MIEGQSGQLIKASSMPHAQFAMRDFMRHIILEHRYWDHWIPIGRAHQGILMEELQKFWDFSASRASKAPRIIPLETVRALEGFP